MRNKILILVPSNTAKGGITNYYSALQSKFNLNVEYFIRGSRKWPERRSNIIELMRAIGDICLFISRIVRKNYKVVQTTTSLGVFSILRDGIFIMIAHIFKKKTIVFFRGWNEDIAQKIEKRYLSIFRFLFFRTDCSIVLSIKFKKQLQKWGYSNHIYVETTIVDYDLLKNISINDVEKKYTDNYASINLLFLSRIEKEKGIYEAVNAFDELVNLYTNLTLTVVGDGFELNQIEDYVKSKNINNIRFLGFLYGESKIKAYNESHIYIFPSHSEGMPNSVLEAIAFGLPVITSRVGGLTDFFRDGIHGFYIGTKNYHMIIEKVKILIEDPKLMKKIAINNFCYAQSNFITPVVLKRIENIYKKYLK